MHGCQIILLLLCFLGESLVLLVETVPRDLEHFVGHGSSFVEPDYLERKRGFREDKTRKTKWLGRNTVTKTGRHCQRCPPVFSARNEETNFQDVTAVPVSDLLQTRTRKRTHAAPCLRPSIRRTYRQCLSLFPSSNNKKEKRTKRHQQTRPGGVGARRDGIPFSLVRLRSKKSAPSKIVHVRSALFGARRQQPFVKAPPSPTLNASTVFREYARR